MSTSYKIVTAPAVSVSTRYSLLGSVDLLPAPGASDAMRFETIIDKVAYFIEAHQVARYGLHPVSVYIKMASTGAWLLSEHHS